MDEYNGNYYQTIIIIINHINIGLTMLIPYFITKFVKY